MRSKGLLFSVILGLIILLVGSFFEVLSAISHKFMLNNDGASEDGIHMGILVGGMLIMIASITITMALFINDKSIKKSWRGNIMTAAMIFELLIGIGGFYFVRTGIDISDGDGIGIGLFVIMMLAIGVAFHLIVIIVQIKTKGAYQKFSKEDEF